MKTRVVQQYDIKNGKHIYHVERFTMAMIYKDIPGTYPKDEADETFIQFYKGEWAMMWCRVHEFTTDKVDTATERAYKLSVGERPTRVIAEYGE